MPATSRGELVKRAARIKPLYKSDQDFLGRGAQCDGQGGDENTAQQRPDVCTDGNTESAREITAVREILEQVGRRDGLAVICAGVGCVVVKGDIVGCFVLKGKTVGGS